MGYDFQDFGEGAWGLAQDFLTGGVDENVMGEQAAKTVPGVSSFASGLQAAYHLGSAVYDGVTGDRDGAVAHGTTALVNGLSAIPVVGDAIGGVDQVLGWGGTVGRYANTVGGTPGEGLEPGDIPTGLDDVLSSAAVGATNLAFGADDSNLIAAGDTPQGTRQGESGAGISTAAPLALSVLGPLGMLASPFVSDALGDSMGETFGRIGENERGESAKVGSTTGAEPGLLAREAASFHDQLLASGMAPPAGPGMMLDPASVPSLAAGNPGGPGMVADPANVPSIDLGGNPAGPGMIADPNHF